MKADTVTFGTPSVELSVPEEFLAVRLENLSDLNKLAAGEVDKLPLDEVRRGLDMVPDESGVWRGWTDLPDGRAIELVMKRKPKKK